MSRKRVGDTEYRAGDIIRGQPSGVSMVGRIVAYKPRSVLPILIKIINDCGRGWIMAQGIKENEFSRQERTEIYEEVIVGDTYYRVNPDEFEKWISSGICINCVYDCKVDNKEDCVFFKERN